jgi:hypothetical protein
MQQAKEEVGKLQFLGVKFFSRVRLKESRLNVHSTFTPIENPSLCIFSRNIDFPKGISSLLENDTWKEISSSLVLLSLFNLSLAKKIELYKFKDLRIFLGLIKLEYESIGFKLLSANEGDDFLENAILKALKRNEANA